MVVDPVRPNAVRMLLQQDVDLVICDDGLQHYALDRAIEFIVVDGQRRFGNGNFIPQGPLREGLERLDSVDFIINNGGETGQGEIAMTLSPGLVRNLLTGEERDIAELDKLVAFCRYRTPCQVL